MVGRQMRESFRQTTPDASAWIMRPPPRAICRDGSGSDRHFSTEGSVLGFEDGADRLGGAHAAPFATTDPHDLARAHGCVVE